MLPIPSLSAADIAEFKSSGFLIKRGVLSATLLVSFTSIANRRS